MESMPAEYRDIDWDGLTHARRALIGNAFTTPPEDLQRGTNWFAKSGADVPRAMLGLCDVDKRADARKLVIAAAHAYARLGHVDARLALLGDAVDAAKERGLRLERNELARLVLGLQRFEVASRKLLGSSGAIREVRETIWTLCFSPNLFESLTKEPTLRRLNVLVLGETGTGKELVADMLGAGAFTGTKPPFIALNCAALPRDLAEVELFGAEKGAYSMATSRREGKIVAADDGTLFLDEIADLSPEVQVKLLSTMSNGRLTPLGTNESKTVNVRYVAATSRPLVEMVGEGKFREDLFQRLAGHVVKIPPLRTRPADVVEIGLHLLKSLRAQSGAEHGDTSSNVRDVVSEDHDERWLKGDALRSLWPGNVRELEAALRQRVLGLRPSAQGEIKLVGPEGQMLNVPDRILGCEATEKEVVNWYMKRVLEKVDGSLTETHRILDIDRSTIRRRLEKLGEPTPADRDEE
jgi:DNA-binding NtrC family response regulator